MNFLVGAGDESQNAGPGVKKRSRVIPVNTVSEWSFFRVQFACLHTGRYIASTKRRIRW